MDLKNNFKESLFYPIRSYKNFILLGTLFIILDINSIVFFNNLDSNNLVLTIFCILDSVILLILIIGNLISIIKESALTVNHFDFEWGKKFIIGLKGFLILFLGIIIPLIMFIIVVHITGTGEYYSHMLKIGASRLTINLTMVFNVNSFISILINIFIVLFFTYFTIISLARLSYTNNLKESINLKNIIKDLKNIGIAHFTLWILIIFALMVIIGIINDNIYYINYIGMIISSYIILPYVVMFLFKSIGNEYSI